MHQVRIVKVPISEPESGETELAALYDMGFAIVAATSGPMTMEAPTYLVYTLVKGKGNNRHMLLDSDAIPE